MTRSVTKFLSVYSMTWLKLKQSGNKSERKRVFEQKLFLFKAVRRTLVRFFFPPNSHDFLLQVYESQNNHVALRDEIRQGLGLLRRIVATLLVDHRPSRSSAAVPRCAHATG